MSTQRQIPGGSYVNQTGTRQAQVPGSVFVNETVSVGGVTAALTGQSITAAQGSVSVQVQSSLSGQSSSLSQGSVVVASANVTAALTGQAIQIAQGLIVAGVATAITGQGTTVTTGSVIAAIAAPITGQPVAIAQGAVVVGGDIVRALTGQNIPAAIGTVSVLSAANAFSQEVAFHKFYMRKGKKLLMFDSVREAEAYTEAETLADEAIAKAKKTSRLARKRLRARIVSDTLPAQAIDTDWLAEMMQRFAINLDLPALLAEQDYNRVLEIYAQAMAMQDEEDIEFLLLMG